ncbi:MAG: universal stress protein [Methylococcales bacterium]|nr:MAG: universal stress protein [Methylococcales bacterium]
MENYKHILLAVDFYEQVDVIVNKAQLLATQNQAKLSIIHVVDSLPVVDSNYGTEMPFNMDLTTELVAQSKEKIAKIANKLKIPSERAWIEIGSVSYEIVRIAEENAVDLIVIGSHGRHGLALLLGSTANSVLHHARCDVLAVRLQNQ